MSHLRLILYVGELLQGLLKVLLLVILLKTSAQKTSKTLAKIIENAKNRGKNKSTFNRRAVDVEVQPPCYFEEIFLEKGFLIVAIFRLILLECC